MGVVIYGSRAYGRVDAHGGEHAQTSFFHIQFVPLVPHGSFWVTQEIGDQTLGFPIKLHLRSVAATYLRVWGVIGAIAAYVGIPGAVGAVLGGALIALSAWSWTWHSLRGKRAALASDFRGAAFGTRCPPELMTEKMRDKLRHTLQVQWGREHTGRSPDEVAQHGSANAAEAITAYGLLHLAAVERGRAGAVERAAAHRLIDGAHEPWRTDAGPYRGVDATPMPSLAAAVAEQARANLGDRPARRRARSTRWFQRPAVQVAGLALATLFAAGGVGLVWEAGGRAHAVTARELASSQLMRERRVEVRFGTIIDPGWHYMIGERAKRVVLGYLGNRVLPIIVAEGDATPVREAVGELRLATNSARSEPWRALLQEDPALDAATFDYVLDQTSDGAARLSLAIGLLVIAGTAAGWVGWLRAWRARRPA